MRTAAGMSTTEVTVEQQRELRSLQLAVALYVVVLSIKIAAYAITGVMALLAEALHTLGDIFVSGFLLIALMWSRRPADDRHLFGYGRAQSAAALVAATLFVSFTALRLYEESIPRLFRPGHTDYDNAGIAFIVLGVSMVLAAAPLVSLVRSRVRGPAAKAQMWELVNDELGLAAALVGTSLALAGEEWADPLAAVVIATIISWKAIGLFRENLCLLLGRAPHPDVLAVVEASALDVPGVVAVRDLRAEYVTPDEVHLGMHVVVARGTSVEEADALVAAVTAAVHRVVRGAYCVIDVDAAAPSVVVSVS